MSTHDEPTLEMIAKRYLGQFPDLQGLARQAAGHVLRRQLGYWLDPDKIYWHGFDTAIGSRRSYTGWQHLGRPRRSLTLTELVIQRFSPQQQDNADLLATYGGFYRVDGSHACYDERNELRLAPQAVLEMFWAMDFAQVYARRLVRFQTQRGEDFCVLARARFLAAVARASLEAQERKQVLAAALGKAQTPLTLEALRAPREQGAARGFGMLMVDGIPARTLLHLVLDTGRHCLYAADDQGALMMFKGLRGLEDWMRGLVGTMQGRERFMAYFLGEDAHARSMRPQLEKICERLHASPSTVRIENQQVPGDVFVRLRDQAMDELASNAHERLTTNAQLRKANWLSGLHTATLVIAPMAPLGWPVALTALGVGMGSLALHLDQAIAGKTAWRAAAWWAVLLDVLYIILDSLMIRSGALFSEAPLPRQVAPEITTPTDSWWGRYMRPAADELLQLSDQALVRQRGLLGQVPWCDGQSVDAVGRYLDSFGEPYAVYQDGLGFGSRAIREYTHAPNRYNNLWRGLPLEDDLAANIRRSHDLAEALEYIGANGQVRLYRAVSACRGTGMAAWHEGRLGVGDVLVTTDFTSFTENPYVLWETFNDPAAQVSGRGVFDETAVVYVLEPGELAHAVPVAPFSDLQHEAESLVMPGRYLRVEEVKAVEGENYRFMQVRLRALDKPAPGAAVHDLYNGELFDREVLAQRLGGGDDSLMRRFFALAS
ncbi:dermonecrotic toxin domain-containing protein [Pseudomonas sp. I2]|uniref:dermonecrotic toxin domain-containing protein n=1 Tax=unclassified Pseudomonas TaxID=196821 RepID=UPI0034D731C1